MFIFLLAYFVDRMAPVSGQTPTGVPPSVGAHPGDCIVRRAGGLYLSQKPLDTWFIKIAVAAVAAGGLAALVWSACAVPDFWAGRPESRALS